MTHNLPQKHTQGYVPNIMNKCTSCVPQHIYLIQNLPYKQKYIKGYVLDHKIKP
jgi:hypothetical protein